MYSFHIPGGIYKDPNGGLPLLAVDGASGTAHLAVSGWIEIPVPAGAAQPPREPPRRWSPSAGTVGIF